MAATELDYLDHIRRDSARFAQVLSTTDPAARVPACPGWSTDDLLWHLTEVQLFWGTIVRERLTDPDPAEQAKPDRPTGHLDLLELFGSASRQLSDTLADTPPDTAVWTWASDRSAGFVRRRQAHEALIHRVDAEQTASAASSVDPELAADGVDEILTVMFGGRPAWAESELTGTTGRVIATDSGRSWWITLARLWGTSPDTGNTYDEPYLEVSTHPGDPDFEITGSAVDLDLWLWNRAPTTQVRIDGARPAIEQFRELLAAGVQ